MKFYGNLRDKAIGRHIEQVIFREMAEANMPDTMPDPDFWFYEYRGTLIFHMDHDVRYDRVPVNVVNKLVKTIPPRFDLQPVFPYFTENVEDEIARIESGYYWFRNTDDFHFSKALAIANVDGKDQILCINYGAADWNTGDIGRYMTDGGTTVPALFTAGGLDVKNKYTWDEFIHAFVKAYHMTPLESLARAAYGPDDPAYTSEEIYEIGAKNIDINECAYSSVCPNFKANKGCIKTCKLSSPVRTSVSPKRFREFQDEALIAMTRIH